MAAAANAAAAACRDGFIEAVVRCDPTALPSLPRRAHGPAWPWRIAGAATGSAAVDGPVGAGCARAARSPWLRDRAHRRQLRRRVRRTEPGDAVTRARTQPVAVRLHAGFEE